LEFLGPIDYCLVAIYFSTIIGIGLYLKKRAGASIEAYLIGARRLPWWALGASGMVTCFDLSGTMIIVSFLYLLGPQGLYIEFRGGVVLGLVISLLWAGKYHRRSRCITKSEWMTFRFGDGAGGRAAQVFSVLSSVALTIGMLAYLLKGTGLFLSMVLPLSPSACAFVLVAMATAYTLISGFYGVVMIDLIQSAILLLAVAVISYMAFTRSGDAITLDQLALEVTGNQDWVSSFPARRVSMPPGYEAYEGLSMLALFYLVRSLTSGAGGGDDPRYFGARNDRECGTLTLFWTSLMMFRWPMMMGCAVLGLYLIRDLFPDQGVIQHAAEVIKLHWPSVTRVQWPELISQIIHTPDQFPPALLEQLRVLLGEDTWTRKLLFVSYDGTVNPERILPGVIFLEVHESFRGFMLIAMLAASLSTFDSAAISTAGLVSRDIFQKYLRPAASTAELIYASRGAMLLIVASALWFAFSVESINDIWGWITMGLTGGVLFPSVLRLYWWRFNGAGYAAGTATGLATAFLQRAVFPSLDESAQLLLVGGMGLLGAMAGTFLTHPVDDAVLANFYRVTRPMGIWGPFRRSLPPEESAKVSREHRNDALAAPFALLWHISLFLLPMQVIVRDYYSFAWTLVPFLVGASGMYLFWYRNLPQENLHTL
jgi:SSS family solute:Na+ symporter